MSCPQDLEGKSIRDGETERMKVRPYLLRPCSFQSPTPPASVFLVRLRGFLEAVSKARYYVFVKNCTSMQNFENFLCTSCVRKRQLNCHGSSNSTQLIENSGIHTLFRPFLSSNEASFTANLWNHSSLLIMNDHGQYLQLTRHRLKFGRRKLRALSRSELEILQLWATSRTHSTRQYAIVLVYTSDQLVRDLYDDRCSNTWTPSRAGALSGCPLKDS